MIIKELDPRLLLDKLKEEDCFTVSAFPIDWHFRM